jgi:hypothetical protein
MKTHLKRIKTLRNQVTRLRTKEEIYRKSYSDLSVELETAKEEAKERDAAYKLLSLAVKTKREETRAKIEKLVTSGLRAVFNKEELEFYFDDKLAGPTGKVGLIPMIRSLHKGEIVEATIVDGHGGGVADVASFLLRVVMLVIVSPALSRVLILDESFKHVSNDYLNGVAHLIKRLNQKLGIQFILVTHKDELLDTADVIYRATLDSEGATQFSLEHDLVDEAYYDSKTKTKTREPNFFDMTGDIAKPSKPDKVIIINKDMKVRSSKK